MKLDIKFNQLVIPAELVQICNATTAVVYGILLSATDDKHMAELSKAEIARRSGVKVRTVVDIIAKLETMGIVQRYYNDGYANRYLVKNILSDEDNPAEQPINTEPTRRSERQQYRKKPVEYVWQASDGGLKPGYNWYGKYNNVALSDKDYASLCSKYSKYKINDYIDRIDMFCEMNGRNYGNYAATIEYWIEKDLQKKYGNDDVKKEEARDIDKYLDLVNRFDD